MSRSQVVETLVPRGRASFGGIWGYVELWFPWPLSNRAMVVKCEVVDVLKASGAILVRGNSNVSKIHSRRKGAVPCKGKEVAAASVQVQSSTLA